MDIQGEVYSVEDLTVDELKSIIANGDDSHRNQLRITKNGRIYLSQDVVGADRISDLAYRYETFDANNEYVGKKAAADEIYIQKLYKSIKANWPKPTSTYIDMF